MYLFLLAVSCQRFYKCKFPSIKHFNSWELDQIIKKQMLKIAADITSRSFVTLRCQAESIALWDKVFHDSVMQKMCKLVCSKMV